MSNNKHQHTLDRAIQALHERTFFAAYPEHPSPKIYGETADKDGQAWFKAQLNNTYSELDAAGGEIKISDEESPYIGEQLNIAYPAFPVDQLISNATTAFHSWRKIPLDKRAELLITSLERIKDRFFDIAYATMHTTGQGYMMAFQASGPHAADRALEAIAAGYEEITRFPERALWDKPMGKYNIQLNKEWRAVPKGVSVVIGCSTFPTWNTVPGMYASLITGNPVIIKPHPGAILPIAIVVAELKKVLKDSGLDENIIQLGVDSFENTITKELAEHPTVKLIDYTGNSAFGDYLEALPNKTVFTEKTGVNSAIIDSCVDADKMVANLAFSAALYSGQMCTAPQNIFIPKDGINTENGHLSFDDIAQKFVEQINGLVDNPKAGPFVLGTIQNPKTCDRVDEAVRMKGKIWLQSRAITNPMFPKARTATPLVLEVDAANESEFSQELFGPILLLIKTKDTAESLSLAKQMAEAHGAISCAAYCTDTDVKETIADEMSLAATPVAFNLTGGIYVNQHAAFSDYHVTGGNPAGNASFTNPEFVLRRFTKVGFREPV
jgi:phenylacetic acid degradation protein paaN